ncbi:hypothetical protein K8I28_12035 [bacterium]|nr:hypothetical protein [bacterium]
MRYISLIVLSLLLITGISSAQQSKLPPGNWEILKVDFFWIYYEAQDEGTATELAVWYSESLPDFAGKLGVPQPRQPIYIFIAPHEARFKYLTRGMPEWTGGAVYPSQRTVILLSPRKLSDAGQFKVTALHEGVHLLTELNGKSHLPRWLAEGLAMYLSGETLYKNRIPLARAVVLNRTFTLDEIGEVLQFGETDARVAYLQSIYAVEYLVEHFGWESVAILTQGFRNGEQVNTLFNRINGGDFFEFEFGMHQQLRHSYRWWKLVEWLDINSLIFGSASILVIVVGIVTIIRRRRYLSDADDDPETSLDAWSPDYIDDPYDGDYYVEEDENY